MSLQPTGTGERGEGSLAPTFVPAKVHQFSKEIPHYPLPGASATVRPTPPDFSMVPPPQEAPNHQTGAQLTPPASIQSLQALFPWIASVPERLQIGKFQTPGQLLLYVGLADSKSLDSTLHQMAPALQGHVLAFDIRRESDHDILQGPLYDQLCTHAWKGDLREREVARIVGLGVSSRNQRRQSDAQNLNVGACQHYSLGNRWTLTTTACFSYG